MEFPYKAPKDYSYEFEENFKKNTKKREYYSPVNSKTVGSVVNLNHTTAYSGMKKPPLNPLEKAFL